MILLRPSGSWFVCLTVLERQRAFVFGSRCWVKDSRCLFLKCLLAAMGIPVVPHEAVPEVSKK